MTIKLASIDPRSTPQVKNEKEAEEHIARYSQMLADLQQRLRAEARHALLIVLQCMDTGGKDGTIKHVFNAVNPLGIDVVAFKAPAPNELAHDYLWRVHANTPAKGNVMIFNRSHYESVLVERVHQLVPHDVWSRRYEQINAFEEMLVSEGTTIVKFYFHISKEEQRERLLARLDDPDKNWKFNPDDLAERKYWDDYMAAYEDAVNKTSTKHAPWHVVPADHKWYRNFVVSKVLVETLEAMNPQYPVQDLSGVSRDF